MRALALGTLCAAATLGARLEAEGSPSFPTTSDHGPQQVVPRMLQIDWSAGPPMPQGMQDNQLSRVGDWIVSTGGFCSGKDKDAKPGKYPRGFLNKVWALNLRQEASGWVALPDLPAAPRQGMSGVGIQNDVYAWGGFSYTAPYAYRKGYRLSHRRGNWKWESLPDFPWPIVWGATCSVDFRIYVLGGTDYDAKGFYTATDRNGHTAGMGARLMVFDTEKPEDGWQERTRCPGTPRTLAGAASVEGKIYILGGLAVETTTGALTNVVDCWRYDPQTDKWQRLRDLPISGSTASPGLGVYKDRYLLLPAGHQYKKVMNPDGSLRPKYGMASQVDRGNWSKHPVEPISDYFNHFYVYDLRSDLYGTAPDLPFDDVASINLVMESTMYLFPSETAGFVWDDEYFGHHPEFVLKGEIKELEWKRP